MREFERIAAASREDLRAWLAANHRQTDSIWLVTWKKAAGERHLPYNDIVEECLCFGWVDSLPRKLDDQRTMLLLSPRKPGSAWSAANKARVRKLIASGLMTPAGLARVEAAKADGSWSFLDDVETLAIPDDLSRALKAHPPAAKLFAAFPPSTRRGVLEWIKQAKTPETRAKRVTETARLAADNIRANTPRQLKGSARPAARPSGSRTGRPRAR